MNEFEALKRIETTFSMNKEGKESVYREYTNSIYPYYEDFDLVLNALTELKAIKEAKPSEALECFMNMQERIASNISTIEYIAIKQALLKADKLEKAIKCIKNRSAYNIELKAYVFVNKLIYWEDDLMLTGYGDNNRFKVEDYGITWKEVLE